MYHLTWPCGLPLAPCLSQAQAPLGTRLNARFLNAVAFSALLDTSSEALSQAFSRVQSVKQQYEKRY